MAVISPEQARGRIARLAHRGLDVQAFARRSASVLRGAVGFEGFCVLTLDPATLLPTREVAENALEPGPRARLTEIELREPDYNKFAALAQGAGPVASLGEATGGRLDRSRRQRELRRPGGFEDELRAVLVSEGKAWGALTLLRERGRPHFTPEDIRDVTVLTGALAEGLRRVQLLGDRANAAAADPDPQVGVVLLAGDGMTIERADPAARALLDELGADGSGAAGRLAPTVLRAVGARARDVVAGRAPDDRAAARARVRTRAGRWLVAHGSVLDDDGGGNGDGGGPDAQVAVVLEPVSPAELAPLVAMAHGLSDREWAVTRLVARGLSTSEIAAQLHLSAWTVQDHLKAIFTKTGTGSRGELVARLFLDPGPDHPGIWDGSRAAAPQP